MNGQSQTHRVTTSHRQVTDTVTVIYIYPMDTSQTHREPATDSIINNTITKLQQETGLLARGSAPASPGRGEAGHLVFFKKLFRAHSARTSHHVCNILVHACIVNATSYRKTVKYSVVAKLQHPLGDPAA